MRHCGVHVWLDGIPELLRPAAPYTTRKKVYVDGKSLKSLGKLKEIARWVQVGRMSI